MTSTQAWKRHGCYTLGSEQYFNMPLERALTGCRDDWNALDHFDPTMNSRRMFSRFFQLRAHYGALQDGYTLSEVGHWTYMIERPGSNGTSTEMGLWSMMRSEMTGYQNVGGESQTPVALLWTNENSTVTYTFNCKNANTSPILVGYAASEVTTVRNLFYPYETYDLQPSQFMLGGGNQPLGCIPSIEMQAYGFKALVPADEWSPPTPALTRFLPGHDARLDGSSTTIPITLEFNTVMECSSVTQSITIEVQSSGKGSTVTQSQPNCSPIANGEPNLVPGGDVSVWGWSTTLSNIPDGVIVITIDHPAAAGQAGFTTNVRVPLFFCSLSLTFFPGYRSCDAQEGRSRQRDGIPNE